jgi:hypothetical protein
VSAGDGTADDPGEHASSRGDDRAWSRDGGDHTGAGGAPANAPTNAAAGAAHGVSFFDAVVRFR